MRNEFKGHRFATVLHEHQENPHVHVVVRAEAMGYAGRAVLSNGQPIQPSLGGAPQPQALRAMRYAVASL